MKFDRKYYPVNLSITPNYELTFGKDLPRGLDFKNEPNLCGTSFKF